MGYIHPPLSMATQPRALKETVIPIIHLATKIRSSHQERNCPSNVLKISEYLHHRPCRAPPWVLLCRSPILRNHLGKKEGTESPMPQALFPGGSELCPGHEAPSPWLFHGNKSFEWGLLCLFNRNSISAERGWTLSFEPRWGPQMPSRKQRKNPAQHPGFLPSERFLTSFLATQHSSPCLLGEGPHTHSVTGPRTGMVGKLQGVWGESGRLVLRVGTGIRHLRAHGTFILSSPRPITCSTSEVVSCLPGSLTLQSTPTWVPWALCVPPASHSASPLRG